MSRGKNTRALFLRDSSAPFVPRAVWGRRSQCLFSGSAIRRRRSGRRRRTRPPRWSARCGGGPDRRVRDDRALASSGQGRPGPRGWRVRLRPAETRSRPARHRSSDSRRENDARADRLRRFCRAPDDCSFKKRLPPANEKSPSRASAIEKFAFVIFTHSPSVSLVRNQ